MFGIYWVFMLKFQAFKKLFPNNRNKKIGENKMSKTVVTAEGISHVEKFVRQINELVQAKKREEVGELTHKVGQYREYGDSDLDFELQQLEHILGKYAYATTPSYVKALFQTIESIQQWCKVQRQKLNW